MSFQNNLFEKIRKTGAIPLDEYMGLCNAHYYANENPFGQSGDFITAPEISQIFGEMIAVWLVDTLGHVGSSEKIMILECGSGRGTMMFDILKTIRNFKSFQVDVKAVILENSQGLISVQKETLKDFDIEWIKDIHSPILKNFEGTIFIIGNEFLDALPIKQFVFKHQKWFERYIAENENGYLSFVKYPTEYMPPLSDPEEGDIYEFSPAIEQFLKNATSIFDSYRQGGMLWIDYGYDKDAFVDTFQAVRSHQYADPLKTPGANDLTAHVKFSKIKDICSEAGLHTYNIITQRQFLQSCGIDLRANQLMKQKDAVVSKEIEQALFRLTDPTQMGTLFKCFAATTSKVQPAGFV